MLLLQAPSKRYVLPPAKHHIWFLASTQPLLNEQHAALVHWGICIDTGSLCLPNEGHQVVVDACTQGQEEAGARRQRVEEEQLLLLAQQTVVALLGLWRVKAGEGEEKGQRDDDGDDERRGGTATAAAQNSSAWWPVWSGTVHTCKGCMNLLACKLMDTHCSRLSADTAPYRPLTWSARCLSFKS